MNDGCLSKQFNISTKNEKLKKYRLWLNLTSIKSLIILRMNDESVG